MSHDRRSFLKTGATLGASLLAAPAFGLTPPHQTQRQAEQSKAADIEFIPEELRAMNDAVSKMTVVEDRYTGSQRSRCGSGHFPFMDVCFKNVFRNPV